MQSILQLGQTLDREWRKRNYDDLVFPRLAAETLSQSAAAWSSTRIEDITEWLLSGEQVAEQFLDGFGQPNIRVYSNHKFRIELLFWFESTTSIHEHSFSGAFGVVVGSSLHTQFDFTRSRRVCRELILGRLNFASSDLLERGAVHTIEPGSSYVHSLYHLDYPSVSIVIRTHEDRPHTPEMRYTRPGLAEASQYEPYPHKTIIALLESTARIDDALFERSALQVISNHDILTAFRAVRAVLSHSGTPVDVAERVFNHLAARDEELALMLKDAVDWERRDRALIKKRAAIKDAEQRFLLALLLNVPDRSTILSLVGDRFPGKIPEDTVFRLLVDMSAVLDVPLRGKAREILATAINSSSVDDFIAASYDKDSASDRAALERAWQALTANPVFTPLFTRTA